MSACRSAPWSPAFSDGLATQPGSPTGYGKKYLTEYRKGLHRTPRAWAWHAYDDANEYLREPDRFPQRWRRFNAFARATRRTSGNSPSIYITEVGIIRHAQGEDLLSDVQMEAGMECLLDELPSQSSRIARFFYYQFRGTDALDTGLIAERDIAGNAMATPKAGMYDVFQRAVDNDPTTTHLFAVARLSRQRQRRSRARSPHRRPVRRWSRARRP